jgi:hypothetical protein
VTYLTIGLVMKVSWLLLTCWHLYLPWVVLLPQLASVLDLPGVQGSMGQQVSQRPADREFVPIVRDSQSRQVLNLQCYEHLMAQRQ